MKIQAIKSQENKSDILQLNGTELNINGTIFPIDNLPEYPTDENADTQAFFEANQCYSQNGTDHIKIYVDQQHFFLFVNNNYLLFHDKDLNGEIDIDELKGLIDCMNLSEEDRRKEHGEYRSTFSAEDWKTRMETCNPLRK